LNGVPEDARLDYEILAWSESGATYSIDQASIGTFVPREGAKKNKADRERWTYEHNRKNSVWKELEKVIGTVWQTDTGRSMKIFVSGIDTGHYNSYAYPYIDKTNYYTIALKGKDADKYIPFGKDLSTFKPARERSNLYLVEVGVVKDQLASLIKLKWDENTDEFQPPNFMNYPQPAKGKYSFKNFFEHYESEERKVESKDGEGISARWVKKTTISQNHFWDVRVYHIALRDILLSQIFKELKIKNYTWNDYCELVKPK
jgi:phage terminase large subunit GpA-like protein